MEHVTQARSPRFVLLAFSLLAGALILRCLALSRFSLGNDEIEEVRWSHLPFHRLLLQAGEEGAHPPLEFTLQMLISRAGTSEWTRRVPSVFAGVGGIALAMFLARRWFGRAAALTTGLLLAFSPIHIRFSQEVRPYALGLFFLTGSIAAVEQYRHDPKTRVAILWFGSVLAALYTLYFAGLLSVIVSVLFISLHRRSDLRGGGLWRALPLSAVGWVLLYLPWLPFVVAVARRQPPVSRETLDRGWLTYHLQVLGTGDWRVEPLSIGSWVFWALVGIGLLEAWRARSALLTSAWLVLGGASQLLVLQLRPHFAAVRHLLPSWLAAVLLAGYAIQLLVDHRGLAAIGLVAVCAIVTQDIITLDDYYSQGRPEWDKVASYLRERVQPGEHVVAANGWAFRNLGYYWSDERQGLEGVALERAGPRIEGPAWIVAAACPLRDEARQLVEGLELKATFPSTNRCTIRFVPLGSSIAVPSGICTGG
jgi:hypothetical protein